MPGGSKIKHTLQILATYFNLKNKNKKQSWTQVPVGVVFQNKHIFENLRFVFDLFFTFWIKRNGKWL